MPVVDMPFALPVTYFRRQVLHCPLGVTWRRRVRVEWVEAGERVTSGEPPRNAQRETEKERKESETLVR